MDVDIELGYEIGENTGIWYWDMIYGIELGYDIGIYHLHFQVPSSMGKEHLEMSGGYLEVNLPHETAT